MLETLRKGMSGRIVRAAQYLIGYIGIKAATGDFDKAFETYVAEWQVVHNLDNDGVIGPKTWTALAAEAPLCSKNKNRTSIWTNALQELLGMTDADGIYGSKTKSAVAAYQVSIGLDADGDCGPLTWNSLICGAAEKPSTTFKQPIDYKQGDSRWAKDMYSSHGDKSQTMKNSGCGPAACADVVATLIDPSVTPWTLAQLSMSWGTRTYSNGTSWSFFQKIFEHYEGFGKFIKTSSITTAKACVDAGGYVVCSMGPGYWTKGGHFICMWKYDGTYIYCNDPASSSRKKQKETDFVKQRKQFFCFWPKEV